MPMFMKLKSLADYKNMTKRRKVMFKKNQKNNGTHKTPQPFPARCRFLFQREIFPPLFSFLKTVKNLNQSPLKIISSHSKEAIIYQTFFLDLPVILDLLCLTKTLKKPCPQFISITISQDKLKFYFAFLKFY